MPDFPYAEVAAQMREQVKPLSEDMLVNEYYAAYVVWHAIWAMEVLADDR